MSFISKLFSKGVGGILGEVAEVVDKFTETKDEKRAFLEKAWELKIKEKESARILYANDNSMQKVYALMFLLAYFSLTGWLIYAIMEGDIKDINQFETGLIGSIWGGMSAKVNTIADFFFGSSDKTNEVKK